MTLTPSRVTTDMAVAPRHAPLSGYATRDGELLIGGVPVSRLAERVGQTPFYAYDRERLDRRVADLRQALPPTLRLSYAIKANPKPALVQHLARRVDGLDVASAGEMMVALDAGMPGENLSFAGPGKTDTELRRAVASGVLVNLESPREIDVLAACSQALGLPARIAVRVNPDFELKSSGMKMGGGPKPFGVDAEAVPALLRDIGAAGLQFEGFHLYAGSQNLRSDAVVEAQRLSFALAQRLAAHAPAPVRHLNLGGGFGIPYFPGEQPLDLAPIAANLSDLVAEAAQTLPGAQLSIELGRYLVGEAGVYVCRVVDRKVSRGQIYLVTDGGLHHHLAASGNFGQLIRKNYPVRVAGHFDAEGAEHVHVVGPLCTPLDVLGERCWLPRAEPGDLMVVFQSGAYGATASPQSFLGHPAAAEVLV